MLGSSQFLVLVSNNLFNWLFQLQLRPLTCYLPIRQDDFDLRSHIESSGHAVSLVEVEGHERGFLNV